MLDMPMSREELTEILCDYIMSIEDVGTLERTWLRNFKPYKMALTVKELQMSLRIDQPMSTSCFNMGVCILAYKDYKVLQYSKSVMPTHFMDLRFCVSIHRAFNHRCLTDYIVLQYMAAWKHARTTPISVVYDLVQHNMILMTILTTGWTSTDTEEFCD
ncbi:hypothetical protein PVAP13_1KG247300 [Panicum virgatum]|uniref:Uncharacterized protein n=1 Tax=Panicum virgatum TaxID=38727 RepID=A0A8T0X9Q5_PANVG|nr:hypothetical protein PVAP13_1KG247300 [Panicum virgatum]